MKIICFVFAALLLGTNTASACIRWSKGGGPSQTFDDLIDTTNLIVQVRLGCQDNQIPKCGFKVVDYLKGADDKSISVAGKWMLFSKWIQMANDPLQYETDKEISDFDGHSDSKFWFREVNRSKRYDRGECHAEFSFEADKEYLIFVDSIGSPFSAELIQRRDDAWLKYVKARLEMRPSTSIHMDSAPAALRR